MSKYWNILYISLANCYSVLSSYLDKYTIMKVRLQFRILVLLRILCCR